MIAWSALTTPAGRRTQVLAHQRLLDRFAITLVLVTLMVDVLGQGSVVAALVHHGVLVFNAGSAILAATSAPRRSRLVPSLIAAGVALAVLGDVLCKIFDTGGATTDISVADPAWLSSYLALCAAMVVVLVRSGGDRRGGWSLVVDGLTVTSVSVLVVWTLTIGRIVTGGAAPLHVRMVWATFPLLQAVLLALVLMTMIGVGSRRMMDRGFAVGVGLWLVTTISYLHAPTATGQLVASATWLAAVVLMARSAWMWQADPQPVAEPGSSRAWLAPAVIGAAPLVVPPLVELVSELLDHEHHPWRLALGSTVLIVLAFVRTARLMRAEQRVLRELERARDAASTPPAPSRCSSPR